MRGSATLNHNPSERSTILLAFGPPKALIRYVYYAFTFSMIFDVADIGPPYTPSKLFGYLLIVLTLLFQSKLFFRPPPKAFWCFATYLLVYVFLGVIEVFGNPQTAEFTDAIISQLFTMSQMLILFWISYGLLRSEKVKQGTLLTLALSCIALASLQALGITSSEYQERVSAMGGNPNTLASVLSLGLLTLVGLAYGRNEIDRKVRLLAWLSSAVLLISIVRTGSRGNVLAVILSLSIFVIKSYNVWTNIKVGLIISAVIGSIVFASYQIEPVRERWGNTYYEGDMAGRDDILAAAWEMFLERPIVGWGPVSHYYELGSRLGLPTRDPHNLYLWLLLEVGLLGAIPYFGGLSICLISAWRGRRGSQGVLPMAMLTYYLLVNLKGTYLDKYFWFVLAYTLASGSHVLLRRWQVNSAVAYRSVSQSQAGRSRYVR